MHKNKVSGAGYATAHLSIGLNVSLPRFQV